MYVPALILEASYSIEGEKEKKKRVMILYKQNTLIQNFGHVF